MSECTGCYNGCTEIHSDKCIRYTGNDITFLGIENDMPLAEVEEKITDYLATVLTGAGIIPTLPSSICSLVSDLLPSSGDITLIDVISALVSSACSLQAEVDSLSSSVNTIEADYTISCLTGVTASSGTHDVLQAVISQLCTAAANITALQNALATYVKISDIDTYIATYLETNETSSTKEYLKMVPYTAVEYYGELSNFTIDGVGIGDWEQIYLCNGLNGTPDKRGRFAVGANTMGGGSYAEYETDPAYYGNPTYDVNGTSSTGGVNKAHLDKDNIPPHKHTVTVTLKDLGHQHLFVADNTFANLAGYVKKNLTLGNIIWHNKDVLSSGDYYTKAEDGSIGEQFSNISVQSVDVTNTGQGISHENRPPYRACYYIMHIPS